MDLSVTTLIPLAAFTLSLLATRLSLGTGISVALAVGYFHGIIRANILSVATSFLFDSAVLGVYVGLYFSKSKTIESSQSKTIIKWITALTLWPLIVSVIPQNDVLIQFVAFRATAWFLPMIWIGSRLGDDDLYWITVTLAGLNLVAFCFGIYEFRYGLYALYPINEVTFIIYKSGDVAGTNLRIPATFLNAHTYGGTMACSLPLLLGQLTGSNAKRRLVSVLLFAGVVAACGGIILCAARHPVVVAGLLLLGTWILTGLSPRIGFGLLVGIGVLAIAASGNERLQRFTTLGETSSVVLRLRGSINESFLDIFAAYPLGAGMGSSAGTSIPYFLMDVAPMPIGLENEYCRILVDQGWVGLFLWLAFLFWVHWPPPRTRPPNAARPIVILIYAMSLTTWGTAVIGTGLLTAIPSAVLLLVQMGVIIGQKNRPSKRQTTSNRQQGNMPEGAGGRQLIGD